MYSRNSIYEIDIVPASPGVYHYLEPAKLEPVPIMETRPSILFICTGNAARSQMAEALLKNMCGDKYDIHSAGTRPWEVRPGAIEVMAEIGIDISKNRSKSVNEFLDREIDYVLTVCDSAMAECPRFPARTKMIHHLIEEPVYEVGDVMARRRAFRKARDEIKAYLIGEFLPEIEKENTSRHSP